MKKNNILEFTFLIDPSWLHIEVYFEFKKAIQKLSYLNKEEIEPFLKARTFKEALVPEKNIKNMSLCMLIAHLVNGCYSLHQGLRRNSLVEFKINIEVYQMSPNSPIKYKSFTCSEEHFNKREYYLARELEIINKNYVK